MSVIKYKKVKRGVFLERPNRFIARVDIDGFVETVHVQNPGRCRELLVKGATVYLSESDNPLRKTKYYIFVATDVAGVFLSNCLFPLDKNRGICYHMNVNTYEWRCIYGA